MNAAMTVDGKIATVSGKSKISSKEDLVRVHKLRSKSDAIMVGISTVLIDNPLLTVRLTKHRRKDPSRVIIDSYGRIPLNSKILKTAFRIETIVFVSEGAQKKRIQSLKDRGAKVIVAGRKNVDLRKTLFYLKEMGFKHILAEGGGELNWSLLNLGVVDQLIVTIAPVIVGGRTSTTLVEGSGYGILSDGIKMELNKVYRQNRGELVVTYSLNSFEI